MAVRSESHIPTYLRRDRVPRSCRTETQSEHEIPSGTCCIVLKATTFDILTCWILIRAHTRFLRPHVRSHHSYPHPIHQEIALEFHLAHHPSCSPCSS